MEGHHGAARLHETRNSFGFWEPPAGARPHPKQPGTINRQEAKAVRLA